jgi:hypothetical protein
MDVLSPRNDRRILVWLILCIFWFSKCDTMYSLYMALKMVYILENESLRLANGMVIGYLLAC